jgi:hypothetical protein
MNDNLCCGDVVVNYCFTGKGDIEHILGLRRVPTYPHIMEENGGI